MPAIYQNKIDEITIETSKTIAEINNEDLVVSENKDEAAEEGDQSENSGANDLRNEASVLKKRKEVFNTFYKDMQEIRILNNKCISHDWICMNSLFTLEVDGIDHICFLTTYTFDYFKESKKFIFIDIGSPLGENLITRSAGEAFSISSQNFKIKEIV